MLFISMTSVPSVPCTKASSTIVTLKKTDGSPIQSSSNSYRSRVTSLGRAFSTVATAAAKSSSNRYALGRTIPLVYCANTRSESLNETRTRALTQSKDMVSVQIFGIKNSQATRAAERFFKERSVQIHFVDLKLKPMAAGEIKRFIDRFKLQGLIDTESAAYSDAGLKYMRVSDSELLDKIGREPKLLKLPFVRCAARISIGHDEAGWKAMLV